MNTDADVDRLGIGGLAHSIAHRNVLLDAHRAADRLQSAIEFNQECVAHRFDLAPLMNGERCTDEFVVFVQQIKGERFITLRQRAITHHVGEHDGSKAACGWRAHLERMVTSMTRRTKSSNHP